jgi:glycosyltransferase involved in cell wall biosynthesis
VNLDKVDLVMWTKNGASTLRPVFQRIRDVIPAANVNLKIIVDDASTDGTPQIARSFGWEVVPNEGKGISDGANTALRHVATPFYVSFEQDLLLARDFWVKVPRFFSDPQVAVASGVRYVYYPEGLKRIEQYTVQRYRDEDTGKTYAQNVKTLDNTIYRTEVIRKIGGYPYIPSSVGVDQGLSHLVFQAGYKWKVDYEVASVHLRNGLKQELAHNYWYGRNSDELEQKMFHRNASSLRMIRRFLTSPVRGVQIAVRMNAPDAIYIYPLMRLSFMRGVFHQRRHN